jgi:transketolase
MRFVFVNELIKYSKKNKDIYLITSDLGYRAFEKFAKLFPKRFINVGVSENNMIGIAAGMAANGKKIFVYSILPFVVFRSLEQIRNNIIHNNLDVNIIGAGGGFSYNVQGISHNTSEDISVLRSLPNLSVHNPGSRLEAEFVLKSMFRINKPSFARLGKSPEMDFYNKKINNVNDLIITKGNDLTIFTTGNILENVYKAVKKLEKIKGYKIKLISVPTLKPVNEKFIIKSISTSKVLSIEENVNIGGLGSVIANSIFKYKKNRKIHFQSLSLKDIIHNKIGSQNYLRKINKLNIENIKKIIIKFLREKY